MSGAAHVSRLCGESTASRSFGSSYRLTYTTDPQRPERQPPQGARAATKQVGRGHPHSAATSCCARQGSELGWQAFGPGAHGPRRSASALPLAAGSGGREAFERSSFGKRRRTGAADTRGETLSSIYGTVRRNTIRGGGGGGTAPPGATQASTPGRGGHEGSLRIGQLPSCSRKMNSSGSQFLAATRPRLPAR